MASEKKTRVLHKKLTEIRGKADAATVEKNVFMTYEVGREMGYKAASTILAYSSIQKQSQSVLRN